MQTPLKKSDYTPGTPAAGSTRVDEAQAEVFQDINFMRDLGPLSRRLNLPSKLSDKLQQQVFNFIEIDPQSKNLNDEFLLSLSG